MSNTTGNVITEMEQIPLKVQQCICKWCSEIQETMKLSFSICFPDFILCQVVASEWLNTDIFNVNQK